MAWSDAAREAAAEARRRHAAGYSLGRSTMKRADVANLMRFAKRQLGDKVPLYARASIVHEKVAAFFKQTKSKSVGVRGFHGKRQS